MTSTHGPAALRAAALSLPLALTLASGCGTPTRGGGELFSDEELIDLEDRLSSELDEARTRRCELPPLRGEALEGPAEADQLALLEPEGALASCLELAAKISPADLREPEPGGPPRPQAEQIGRIEAECGAVGEAVQRAVSHQDSCSPYLPGRRQAPSGKLVNAIRAERVLAVLASKARREGQVDTAVATLLDGLRFSQDLSRGGAGLLMGMIGAAAAEALYPAFTDLLDRSGYLADPLLDQVERELTLLLEAEPHPSELLAGERLTVGAEEYLGRAKRPEGAPDAGLPRSELPPTKDLGYGIRTDQALAQLAFERVLRSHEAQCPPELSPRQCRIAVDDDARRFAAKAEHHPLRDVARAATGGRAALRERLIEVLAGVATGTYGRSIDRSSRRGFMLAALRLHVAVRREVEATGLCASPDPLGGDRWGGLRSTTARPDSRWAALLRDPYTGAALQVTADRPEVLVVRSQASSELGGDLQLEYTIDCAQMSEQIRRSREQAERPTPEEGAAEGAPAGEAAPDVAGVSAPAAATPDEP